MDSKKISTVLFSPTDGDYFLVDVNSDTIYRFRSDDAVSIAGNETVAVVKGFFGLNEALTEFRLLGDGINPRFKFRYNSDEKEYAYFGDLSVTCENGRLRLVNSVNLESYVGRVVQAEVGHGAEDEYYRIQSIICRTYAMRNQTRHSTNGYDLCDRQHCQVYSGQKTASNEIVRATATTSGLVMVSQDGHLILSAFHANCGGQTANSEDVWKEARSYLRAATDTFCLSERSATWSRIFKVDDFFARLDFNISEEDAAYFTFYQSDRRKFFTFANDSIELGRMRRLFRLQSTYFNLRINNGQVVIDGRGYGHGVGLCQQGAMKMTEFGYDHSQILGYYYKGVSLVSLEEIR